MNQEASTSLFRYRVKLIALVAVFLSPFVLGWLGLYVFEWRPEAGNYGQLVQPIRKIDWPVLESSDGKSFEDGFGRRWSLLLFAGERCAEDCRQSLFYMRQMRTLLGRDTLRLQNVLITSAPLGESMKTYLREFPNLVVIENFRDAALYRQFSLDGEVAVGASPKLYLVDPDDNFMMHYPAAHDEKRVLEDIRKLMKLSQIG
jgi:cytochrome oxidase Cu insertion factor (SCO1/SenC/PrrC family)